MKSQLTSLVVSILLLAAGAGGFWLLVNKSENKTLGAPQPVPPLVQTVTVTPHEGSLDLVVDGIVAPFREIQVAAEVAGRVVYKDDACDSGEFVTAGTVLLRIDPRDYELAVQRLTQQLEQADANIDELDVEISNTVEVMELSEDQVELEAKEVARLAGLVEDKVVTDSALDRARQVELNARNALLQAKNQLQLLKTRQRRLQSAMDLVQTDLDQARLDLQRTEIKAAVDGVVVEEHVEENSYVQKGEPLLTIEDTSAVEVKCRLRMEELHWVWRQAGHTTETTAQRDYQIPQTPVTISYELAGREGVRYQWDGVLSRYDGIGLDETTRTVPCRVFVEKPRAVRIAGSTQANAAGAPPALVRGMFVTVKIHVRQRGQLVSIPERAVQPGKSVWVVRGARLTLLRSLQLVERVERLGEQGEVERHWLIEAESSGIKPDDRVVVPPFSILTEGMNVRESAG